MNTKGEQTLRNELLRLWQYKWWVGGATLAGGLIMLVYTLPFITPPEFASTGAFVPPSLQDVKSLNFLKIKYSGFGAAEVEDLERISAALQSDSALKIMAQKFDLEKHYRIDPEDDAAQREKALRLKYESKVKIGLSANSVVQIEVLDEDPKLAARMVNALIAYADSVVETVARRKEGIENLKTTLRLWEERQKQNEKVLGDIRLKHKVYHLDNLSEEISRTLAPYFARDSFHIYYDKVQADEHFQHYMEGHISDVYNELVFREENLKTYPSLINVMSYGVPSEVKARPKRMVYIFLGLFFGFVGASLVVLAIKKR